MREYGVALVLFEELLDVVLEVIRYSDQLMIVIVLIEGVVIQLNGAYAP